VIVFTSNPAVDTMHPFTSWLYPGSYRRCVGLFDPNLGMKWAAKSHGWQREPKSVTLGSQFSTPGELHANWPLGNNWTAQNGGETLRSTLLAKAYTTRLGNVLGAAIAECRMDVSETFGVPYVVSRDTDGARQLRLCSHSFLPGKRIRDSRTRFST